MPIDVSVAKHDLDIAAGFVERNSFDEFGGFTEGAPSPPEVGAAGAGIVGRESEFGLAAVRVEQIVKVVGTEFDIAVWVQELC